MAVETVASERTLTRSTLIVFVGFAIAMVVSLAQTFLIANVFGVGEQWDAFIAANQIPDAIVRLISGGALTTALIPIFSGLLARDARADAWKLASHVLNTILIASLIASVVAFIAAPTLVRLWAAPGLPPEAQVETVSLMRTLLIATVIFAVSGTAMGLLQSHNRFLAPAIAPVLFDLGILFGAGFLVKPFGVYGIAFGSVIGAVLHLAVQIPALIRVGARWTPGFGWSDPQVRRVFLLMAPRIVDLGVFTFNMNLAVNLASRLGEGAISAFSWSYRLMQIPQTLIGTAMGIVIFPTLAALSELNDVDGKRSAMAGALKFILIGTIPSAIGLILIGRPAISLLEGGAFDAAATDLVYIALRGFALGVVVQSIVEVGARSFFADKDTLTPLLIAAGGAVINTTVALIATGIPLAALFDPNVATPNLDPASVGGITWANTLGVCFEVTMLLLVLRRRWHGIQENALARTVFKTLAASLVMGAAVVAFEALWQSLGLAGQGRLMTIVQVAVEGLIGAVVFIGCALLLRMDEIRTILSRLLRRNKLAEAMA
ncbi:MAG: murein biosynthesis integral membrane protein MurJ [Anaerolineae bacterium]|nr:murein biosynthesis integral membrane protein MurJ [Anaerolineae bacterium]